MALEKRLACLVTSSCSSRGRLANRSYFVPMSTGMAVCHVCQSRRRRKPHPTPTLLKPLAWRYHSLTLLSVAFRVRSNMNRMATASFDTSGSMDTNSRWPPRSHICCQRCPTSPTHRERNLRVPDTDGLLHKVDAERLDIVLAACQQSVAQGTHSKLPSTYLTMSDVLPICESPTMPTLSTILSVSLLKRVRLTHSGHSPRHPTRARCPSPTRRIPGPS